MTDINQVIKENVSINPLAVKTLSHIETKVTGLYCTFVVKGTAVYANIFDIQHSEKYGKMPISLILKDFPRIVKLFELKRVLVGFFWKQYKTMS